MMREDQDRLLVSHAYVCAAGNEGRIPTYPVRFDVKKFGAKGDGQTGKQLGRDSGPGACLARRPAWQLLY